MLDKGRLKFVSDEEKAKRMEKVADIVKEWKAAKEEVNLNLSLTDANATTIKIMRTIFGPEYSDKEIFEHVFESGLKLMEKKFYFECAEIVDGKNQDKGDYGILHSL